MFTTKRVILTAAIVGLVHCSSGHPQPPAATRTEAVVIKAGAVQSLEIKSGKPLRSARSTNEAVVLVAPNEQDPKAVMVRGVKSGVGRLVLNDGENDETVVVAVEEPTANERTVRQSLGKALHDSLQAERDPALRLMMAEALIRVAPDDATAARELVDVMNNGAENLPADAYLAMTRVISESPSALVTALIPLLKSRDDTTRQRAVTLLLKVDPKALP
jgi:hypothetical protein